MAALSKVLRSVAGGRVAFWCPGCRTAHHVVVDGPHAWGWNRDVERPTLTPSVLVDYPHLSKAAQERARAFFQANGRHMTHDELPYDARHVCHSFVEAGRIQFLSDSSHALAGQTVDLPAWPSAGEVEPC